MSVEIELIGNLPSNPDGTAIPKKWALFDLDWTLIRPIKGKIYKYQVGWKWLPGRLERLADFIRDDYQIGIVTNQKPWPMQSIQDIRKRLISVHQDLKDKYEIEVPILAGITSKEYRKPAIGWLNHLILLPGSLYVGDAAGRPGDYNDSDLKFAENAHLPFYPPEQVFTAPMIPEEIYSIKPILLTLMGAPASGKSTFSSQLGDRGWIWINSDQYKSNVKQIISALKSALNQYGQIVLDATNPRQTRRLEYKNLAEEYQVPFAIVHFLNPGEDRNKLRPKETRIPTVAYNQYWKQYQEPDPEVEGVIYEVI